MLEDQSRMGEVLERLGIHVDERFRDAEGMLENAGIPTSLPANAGMRRSRNG